jgi:SPP1 gp7 family putative phage head morphogenesis protein
LAEGFWLTDVGIAVRIESLSRLVVTRTYNNALQVAGKDAGIKGFEYLTARDDRVCPICAPFDGRRYRSGQFMPILPKHPGCRCLWDVWFESAESGVMMLG